MANTRLNLMTRFLRAFAALAMALALCAAYVPAAFAQTSDEFLAQGNANYNAKKYADAVKSYAKAIQLQPKTQLKAYLNCARAYNMLGDYVNSKRFYDYYFEVSGDTSDKKVAAEYKAVTRKVKNDQNYVRPDDQARVLVQLQSTMMSGPYINSQGGGAAAYYNFLMRTGFAEPMIADLQKQLVNGILSEISEEILPIQGQPLPALDRVGWENERNKLAKATQFVDVTPDQTLVKRIENTAFGWEAYHKSDYVQAVQFFDAACDDNHPIPAAYWGRMMTAFHTDSDEAIFQMIDKTESIYKQAGYVYDAFFALLRAQVYKSQAKYNEALEQLDKMGASL